MVLLIDNYDSFVYNLARYFERLGQETLVIRNDAIDAECVGQMLPDAIVLSPGPCTPREAGVSLELVKRFSTELPILGVCLGHQVIGEALGGKIIRAHEPMHGRTSQALHRSESLFAGLPTPITVCRYHSLVIDPLSLPKCLQVTASLSDGSIMAIAHEIFPVVGVQFHPESILTDVGYSLLSNFLKIAGIALPEKLLGIEDERVAIPAIEPLSPQRPVTF
jgi:anthranilate synthase/aminodeoxychorismate synthase-like glutamine amidotransferase